MDINRERDKFLQEVLTFKQYPHSMLNDFYEYWTETNPSKTKLKFQMEKTWETSKRLARWARNNFQSVKMGSSEPVVLKPKNDYDAKKYHVPAEEVATPEEVAALKNMAFGIGRKM